MKLTKEAADSVHGRYDDARACYGDGNYIDALMYISDALAVAEFARDCIGDLPLRPGLNFPKMRDLLGDCLIKLKDAGGAA